MAAPAEARSSCDKEELKEKLASLRKQYRKTFGRLQRAARTEKAKSHVKETIARQNCWLLQAAAEEDPAASSRQVTHEASASHLPGSCSETNALRTPSVTFNLEPEVFSPGGSLPGNWGSECPDRTHGRILWGLGLPAVEKKPSRLSRSRRKGPPRGPLEERREGAPESGKEGPSLEGPQSPVFTRLSSSFEIDGRTLTMPLAVAAREGSSPAPSLTPQPESPQGENITPKVLHQLPGILLEESRGLSPEPFWNEGISATPEDSAVKDMAFLAHAQKASEEKEGDRVGEEEDRCGSASSEGAREPCQEGSLLGEPQSSSCRATDSPVSKPGEAGSRGEAEAGSPPLQAVSPSTPTHSRLDSCTVVEGLLFPVEYYVRTTRRMSRCQRELNLEAVIQSQLGKRRRDRRVSLKDTVPSPTPSAQELPGSGALSAPPQAGRERRSRSPLALESPRAGEGLPQSGAVTRRGRKGRGRPRHGTPSHGAREPLAGNGCLGSSERCQPEPQEQAGNWGHSGMEPAPKGKMSSPPGRRRSRPRVGVLLGCPLTWLPSDLALQEFHLPAEEFGLLQSEKVRASTRKPPEAVGAGKPLKHLQGADPANLQAAEESPGDVLFHPEDESSELRLPPQDLHSSKLLISPTDVVLEGGSSQLESQLPTPLFPLVGPTPATQDFRGSPGQGQADPSQEPSAKAEGAPIRGTGEMRSRVAMLCPEDGEGASRKPDEPAVQVEARQELTAKSGEQCEASVNQQEKAEDLAAGPTHRHGEGDWKMTSKLQNSAGSCAVDVSAVWWEIADFTELCVVTACEASVALWRHLDPGCWETVHTWSFAEVPVFQIVLLPGAPSVMCVALGDLEIAEVRLLFRSLSDSRLQQPLVKAGNIKAVLGLSGRRLVSSCDGVVEVLSIPDAGGGCVRQTLFPPEETTLAFAAVDGMAEALVGLTAANCVVVWNLRTRQLLCQMPLGYSYPAPVCHQAYSDSGLLFVVLSHPHGKVNESSGSPAFQVVAFNPKTARSARVMTVTLPPDLQGRNLEGDVRDASAAAVLTSGAIAVWDLLRGECTALLPPSSEGRWSLVRWSVTDKCLLASRADGSVCVYSYVARPCSIPEAAVQQDGQSSWPDRLPTGAFSCQKLLRLGNKQEQAHRDFSSSLLFSPRTG